MPAFTKLCLSIGTSCEMYCTLGLGSVDKKGIYSMIRRYIGEKGKEKSFFDKSLEKKYYGTKISFLTFLINNQWVDSFGHLPHVNIQECPGQLLFGLIRVRTG